MKLRLLVTKNCNRNCTGCCNKDWDLDGLPEVDLQYTRYDEIILTGGEPLLNVDRLKTLCEKIHVIQPRVPIFVYTACVDIQKISDILGVCDGMTLTLHTPLDGELFFNNSYNRFKNIFNKSLRLHVFKGIQVPKEVYSSRWKVKENIVWIKNCPLPVDEVFRKGLLY